MLSDLNKSNLIFYKSRKNSLNNNLAPKENLDLNKDLNKNLDIPENYLRNNLSNSLFNNLPNLSELEVVRHYTQLSQKNFSIDTHVYPLGSCTMKYNPRAAHRLASQLGFLNKHPLAHDSTQQGFLACLYELQEILMDLTGMTGVSLSPMAGAQGELAGVLMIKAYHQARGDITRTEFLIPDAAHGTNPATAAMAGFIVKEIPTNSDGDVDLELLKQAVGPKTAGIMLTNPSTLGLFERNIGQIAEIIHEAGGLLYYDGANLNAIMGYSRPGDMGFDVMHMNLHKTFATPHGGGGPGSGPVLVNNKLKPYLPIPVIDKDPHGKYFFKTRNLMPDSIGRLSAFHGNAGILLRAYVYARLLGREGLKRASEIAVLNANYLMVKLEQVGYTLGFSQRRATHEFILTMQKEYKNFNISALDIAKRLLDYGFHAPTMYFPLLIPECLLVEPTETESKRELDLFVDAMENILKEIKDNFEKNPSFLKNAPYSLSVKRLDDVKAAKELDIAFK